MLELVKENAALFVDALQLLLDRMSIWWLLFYAACYILMSVGLYTLAKRRVIANPWLAWLPIGNMWILGGLCDQYRKLVKGTEKSNSQKRLLWISVTAVVLLVVIVVLLMAGLAFIAEKAPILSVSNDAIKEMDALTGDARSEAYLKLMAQLISGDRDLSNTVSAGLVVALVLLILLTVAVIDLTVEMYRALYFLYASSLPKHAVWFLVVSIVLNVEAVFVFICRKQNQGMPHDKKGRIQVI